MAPGPNDGGWPIDVDRPAKKIFERSVGSSELCGLCPVSSTVVVKDVCGANTAIFILSPNDCVFIANGDGPGEAFSRIACGQFGDLRPVTERIFVEDVCSTDR